MTNLASPPSPTRGIKSQRRDGDRCAAPKKSLTTTWPLLSDFGLTALTCKKLRKTLSVLSAILEM